MNQNELERYKQEMMKLYGKRREEPEKNYSKPEDEEIFNVNEDSPNDTAYSEFAEDEEDNDFDEKFPEPDISEITSEKSSDENDYASEKEMGSDTGYILVNVRKGDESSAVENAVVMVTAIVDGKRLILANGTTNSSGTTPKFAVPAPNPNISQSPDNITRPYSLYDVSVTAEGFFNARSVDVPVFAGITSVQNFSMIPVPTMMKGNDEIVTYYNQEPDFQNIPENERN